MDSLTQIVLGASVAEAVGGKKLGNKAALWGAIAGTIPDLDVFLRFFYHPIESSLNKRVLKALSKVDHVIANSKFTKELALKYGVKDVVVINPGCNYPILVNEDAKLFAKKVYDNSSPKLITVSRLDRRKSHRNILMTIKNLLPKYPNLKYVSIGDGDERKNLQNLRKELSLENNVDLIFKSSEQEKVGLLEQSDIFIMPSVVYKKSVEGFGIAFIEAACYGKPSIGGIYGGEADAIKSGETGYLCNGNDLNALYETLLKLLSNEHYKKLGENAFEFSRNFNWDKIIKSYINLI